MPIDTIAHAAPAIIAGETPAQRAARLRARERTQRTMATLISALHRLDALGLSVKTISFAAGQPCIEIAPTWRAGQLGTVWTVDTTASHRLRRADLHGCRVEWREPIEPSSVLAAEARRAA